MHPQPLPHAAPWPSFASITLAFRLPSFFSSFDKDGKKNNKTTLHPKEMTNKYICYFSILFTILYSVPTPMPSRLAPACRPMQRGFTLIEIMVVLVVVAILAAIALPSYQSYVNKSRAKGAAADLMALSLALENRFQKSLGYTAYTTQTTIPAKPADRTAPLDADFGAWIPSQAAFFSYAIESTASSYTIQATGSGALSSCTLSLTQNNVRNAASSCSILGAW